MAKRKGPKADETGRVPLDEISPHPENPKQHDIPMLVGMIRKYGFLDPVVIDQRTGLLVAGHGRCEALRQLRDGGWDPPAGVGEGWTVPVYEGWSSRDDDEARGVLVALNSSTEAGGWDEETLRTVLERLSEAGQMDATGYGQKDLDRLRDKLDKVDPPAPAITFSPELMESQNFVLLVFDNDMDWHTAQVRLGLGPVHGEDSRPGYERKGLGRCVEGVRVIEALPEEGIGNVYER